MKNITKYIQQTFQKGNKQYHKFSFISLQVGQFVNFYNLDALLLKFNKNA